MKWSLYSLKGRFFLCSPVVSVSNTLLDRLMIWCVAMHCDISHLPLLRVTHVSELQCTKVYTDVWTPHLQFKSVLLNVTYLIMQKMLAWAKFFSSSPNFCSLRLMLSNNYSQPRGQNGDVSVQGNSCNAEEVVPLLFFTHSALHNRPKAFFFLSFSFPDAL